MVRLHAESKKAAPAPDADALATGTISDFTDGLTARFGAGWSETSDAIMGGTSTASLSITEGGADTPGALVVEGEVTAGYLFPWAGAMFSPGAEPMAAADLSSKAGIAFIARGDSGMYQLSVMAASRGFMPVSSPFEAGEGWVAHEVAFEQLGLDATDITAIMFICQDKRSFRFEIDDVALI